MGGKNYDKTGPVQSLFLEEGVLNQSSKAAAEVLVGSLGLPFKGWAVPRLSEPRCAGRFGALLLAQVILVRVQLMTTINI